MKQSIPHRICVYTWPFIFVIPGFFTSCSPVVYSNIGQNVPLFREKGEVAVGGGLAATSPNGSDAGVEIKAAVATGKHSAVITSFYSLSGGSAATADDGSWEVNGNYFEAGYGLFGLIRGESKVIYEVFGGIGMGSIKNTGYLSTLNLNYIKPFIQPSVGISGKVVELAFTPRIGLVSYLSPKIKMYNPDEQKSAHDFFNGRKTNFVFEPGVTFRIGYKNVKLHCQYVYSTFNNPRNNNDVGVENEFISLGINFLLVKRWSRKTEN